MGNGFTWWCRYRLINPEIKRSPFRISRGDKLGDSLGQFESPNQGIIPICNICGLNAKVNAVQYFRHSKKLDALFLTQMQISEKNILKHFKFWSYDLHNNLNLHGGLSKINFVAEIFLRNIWETNRFIPPVEVINLGEMNCNKTNHEGRAMEVFAISHDLS